jgi:hypothetical protein
MLHWRFTYVIMDPKPYKESKNGRTWPYLKRDRRFI